MTYLSFSHMLREPSMSSLLFIDVTRFCNALTMLVILFLTKKQCKEVNNLSTKHELLVIITLLLTQIPTFTGVIFL